MSEKLDSLNEISKQVINLLDGITLSDAEYVLTITKKALPDNSIVTPVTLLSCHE